MTEKRSKQPRRVEYTRTFEKSWKRYNNAGRHDMHKAAEIMMLIFSGRLLPAEYLDHELKGPEWAGARELHIGGDFFLVYRVDEAQNLVTFIDIGTHSELFG
ncbi:type II toxin-antitoxin system YafQ family toxin [Enterobacter sp.]|uniref:type II toxin-antitoxin system YafQ family toxin n=1 Tax=Enterobacter sp. TaxID=42895 RepID=UPI00296FEF99|nr:type II toxin-antitoxin system YafQ family toxin [Enterobacter sp.]